MLSVSLLVTGEGEETGVTVVENKFETLALITKRSINEVLRGDKAYLVLFKKSSKEKNCDRCVEFNEVWEQAVHEYIDVLGFAVADVDTRAGRDFADKFEIGEQGFPNVKMFSGDRRPIGVVTRETVTYEVFESRLKPLLAAIQKGADGFYHKSVNDDL